MRHSAILCVLLICVLGACHTQAQTEDHYFDVQPWAAKWISYPDISGTEYGVYHFRKTINISDKPATYTVKVSADNRYKLFINGKLVSLGPARGDLHYWNYETVDLAPYLKTGKNVLAALVWNDGHLRTEAQITNRTGFIMQGGTDSESAVNTNNSWKCIQDDGFQVLPYYGIASSGQFVDMSKVIKGWRDVDFDDSKWPSASELANGIPKGASGDAWMLVPSQIPQMELTYERIPVLRKTEGMEAPAGFPLAKKAITIPANATVTLLLDQQHLTNAYFTLKLSQGKDASVAIGYAEALYDKKDLNKKGNRNEIEGKYFRGLTDSVISDGSIDQDYTTLFWRTYRYVQLRISTHDSPLVIEDIYGTFTGYPFKFNAKFQTDNKEIKDILAIGWRTARLDAMETYMDCPYYEQLQYIGDTRIQAEVSYFNSGDDRLARNAINLMDHSRLAEGVTMSRWPTRTTQVISTFSLWYIGMLHDYWMYRPDSDFIKDKLTGERDILHFFSQFQGADGSMKNVPYWKFVDWVGGPGWTMGEAPRGKDGSSAMLDLQLLKAYQWAAALESNLGMAAYASLYSSKAAQLKKTIQTKYWSPEKQLYADTKEKNTFSQHVNSMAILAGLVPKETLKDFSERLLTDTSLVQCTIYFKYYLNRALVKGGLGDGYMDWLGIWKDNIRLGLTTWAEDSNLEYVRSDCHAWGASPNIEFFRTVLGIDSDSPGFKKVKIEPHLGKLTNVSGEIPHPDGKVKVAYRLTGGNWKADIELPKHITGRFIWKGKQYDLKAGANTFSL